MNHKIIKNINESLDFLSLKDKRRYWFYVLIQCGVAVLDLAGIAIFGIVGALTITGIQSQNPTKPVSEILTFLKLNQNEFHSQILVLTFSAIVILTMKTLVSVYYTKRALSFLTKRSAHIAMRLTEEFFSQEIKRIHSHPLATVQYKIGPGVSSLVVGVLGNTLSLLGDFATLLILAIGILILNPSIAVSSILVFGSCSVIMYKYLQGRSRFLASNLTKLSMDGNTEIANYYEAFREIKSTNVQNYFLKRIELNRYSGAELLAEQVQLPNISKYLIETLLILGSVTIASIQFYLNDAAHAVSSLTVFFAASTRITPSLLRIQQSIVQINASIEGGAPSSELIKSLDKSRFSQNPRVVSEMHSSFSSTIEIEKVHFKYDSDSRDSLENVTLTVKPGEFVAIVGPSGAGKSTLFDLILGLNFPTTGTIKISHLSPLEAIQLWPGAIAYVPQVIKIIDGSIADNVALGVSPDKRDDAKVIEALAAANLLPYVESLNRGIHEQVSDQGLSVSGGQRQRIGIARAFYTNPQMILMDESTSALDAQLESDIAITLRKYHGEKTIVMIAHRLSSIINADQIFYFDSGKLIAHGRFSELRKTLPEFNQQAILMGL